MSISILCPTRGRPDQCRHMLNSVEITSHAAQVTLGVVTGDEVISRYGPAIPTYQFNDMVPTVQKWNHLADVVMNNSTANLFMLGSDDMYFDTSGWDKALLDHYNALENKIHCYALQDSRDEDGTPHPIVTREWIEAMGYFIPPIFLHWFADSWTVGIAKANNCFTHMKDYLLVHDKPSDQGKPDETHSRIRSFGWRERDAYVAETCGHYLNLEKMRLSVLMNEHRQRKQNDQRKKTS